MRVYVAGKYRADTSIEYLNNIRNAIKMSATILKIGHSPFCAHLDHQFHFHDPSLTVEDCQRYCLDWLEVSDVMLVLSDFENSKGTLAEIERAKELKIPIIYSITELE